MSITPATQYTPAMPAQRLPIFYQLPAWSRFAGLFAVLGALTAGASVVFSAAFAHLPVFAQGVPLAVQTALSQQQFHALGLLLVGLAIRVSGPSRWLQAAGWLMCVGLVLFSFNLYARYVLGLDALRGLVPWGGVAFISAWLSLAWGCWRQTGLKNAV